MEFRPSRYISGANIKNIIFLLTVNIAILNVCAFSGCVHLKNKNTRTKTFIINPPPRLAGAIQVFPRCKNTADSYEYLERTEAHYTDPLDRFKYQVVLDTQIDLTKGFEDEASKTSLEFMNPEDVGYLAWQSALAWDKKFNGKNAKEVKHGLSRIHVIIAKDQLHLKQIFNELHVTDTNFLGKMIVDKGICFETPGSTFTMVLIPKSFVKGRPSTVAHEIAHMVGYTGKGSTDPTHKDPDLWWKKDREESIQAMAMTAYELYTAKFGHNIKYIEMGPDIIDVHVPTPLTPIQPTENEIKSWIK